MKRLIFTQAGIDSMHGRIEKLSERLNALKKDAKHGDGQQHENASHEHLELEAQGVAWQIGELCSQLNLAVLVEAPANAERVAIGTQVKIRVDDGPEVVWKIAGHGESDPDKGIVAYSTPLAEALMDASEGACLARVLAAREVDIEIIEISLYDTTKTEPETETAPKPQSTLA